MVVAEHCLTTYCKPYQVTWKCLVYLLVLQLYVVIYVSVKGVKVILMNIY